MFSAMASLFAVAFAAIASMDAVAVASGENECSDDPSSPGCDQNGAEEGGSEVWSLLQTSRKHNDGDRAGDGNGRSVKMNASANSFVEVETVHTWGLDDDEVIFRGGPFHSRDNKWGAVCSAVRESDGYVVKSPSVWDACLKKCAAEDNGYEDLETSSPGIYGCKSVNKEYVSGDFSYVTKGEKALFGTMTGQEEYDESKYAGRWWENCDVTVQDKDYECKCRMYYKK